MGSKLRSIFAIILLVVLAMIFISVISTLFGRTYIRARIDRFGKQCEVDSDCEQTYFEPCIYYTCLNKSADRTKIDLLVKIYTIINPLLALRECIPAAFECKCIDHICTVRVPGKNYTRK